MALHLTLVTIDRMGDSGTPAVHAESEEFPAIAVVGKGYRGALLAWCEAYERYQAVIVGEEGAE